MGDHRRGLGRAAEAASQNAVALGYVTGWRFVRLLPERSALRLFTRIADSVHRRDGRGVQRLRSNLGRVRPDLDDASLDRLTHEAVRSYLRYWTESFRLPSWPIEDVVRRTRTVNESVLRDAYAGGDGVVVALPHMANWDWGGAWACATGMPLTTVAERLEPERLYDEFVAYRATLGMEILPAGDPATFGTLLNRLEEGGFVCLLADRDMSRSGVQVLLCDQAARMPRGPAELARRTGTADRGDRRSSALGDPCEIFAPWQCVTKILRGRLNQCLRPIERELPHVAEHRGAMAGEGRNVARLGRP